MYTLHTCICIHCTYVYVYIAHCTTYRYILLLTHNYYIYATVMSTREPLAWHRSSHSTLTRMVSSSPTGKSLACYQSHI